MTGPIDLFVVAGQSNAKGNSPGTGPSVTVGHGYQWTMGGAIAHLSDPVGPATTGSAWPAFGNAVYGVTGTPVCIMSRAVAGSSLLAEAAISFGDWSSTGVNYQPCVDAALACKAALTAAGWTPTLRGVLWHQGERDAQDGGVTQAEYEAALVDLRTRFAADLSEPDLPLYVFRVGRMSSGDTVKWQGIRAAQDAVCAAQDWAHMVYTDCVNFPDLGFMQGDGLHYTQAGYDDMGTEGGQTVAALLDTDPGGSAMAFSDAAVVVGATAIKNAITHFQLHSGAPGAAGTSNVVGTRVANTGTVDSDGDITWSSIAFTGLTANQAVSYVSYWSASSGGTFYGSSATTGDTTANSSGEYTVDSIIESSTAS